MRSAWCLLGVLVTAASAHAEPWRLDRAAGAPAWLSLGIEQQARGEYLANDFRAGLDTDASAVSVRTLVRGEARARWLVVGLELQDARTYASDATPLNTTHINALDLLQLHAGVRTTDVLSAGDALDARAGRITIDLGMRRIVARNRFRTTINGFTGVDASWRSAGKHVVRAIAAVPVTRLPADGDALEDNAFELDRENTDTVLWAAYYASPPALAGTQLETYAVGLHERDGDIASRDRQLLTLALRWFKRPAPGAVDFELELMPQAGRSRATTRTDDVRDLDHRAWSSHVELGISPAIAWRPRLALQHDYASGDRDPDDGATQRFDPLFGARRFDWGPTGVYGAFARSNIQSPGVRSTFAPTATVDVMASYRLLWLASASDAWTAAGVRDASGQSGRFVAEHAEIQLRWSPWPRNLSLEVGAAILRRGHFAKSAPDTRTDAAVYGYTMLSTEL